MILFICRVCGQQFPQFTDILNHYRNRHEAKKEAT